VGIFYFFAPPLQLQKEVYFIQGFSLRPQGSVLGIEANFDSGQRLFPIDLNGEIDSYKSVDKFDKMNRFTIRIWSIWSINIWKV